MNKFVLRCLSAASALSMLLPLAAMDVSAADRKKMVVVGDSISAGTGLSANDLSYVDILASSLHADVVNLADPAADSTAVLAALDRSDVKAELATADYIVLTAGLHDIMDPFAAQADVYREEFGFRNFSDLFTAKLKDYDYLSEADLNTYSAELSSKIKQNKSVVKANVLAIGDKLAEYSSAQVIIVNAYNVMDTIEKYESMSAKRQLAYDGINNPFRAMVRDFVNASYTKTAAAHGYTVVDAFTPFTGLAYKYTYPEELVCDPTPLGHQVIAQTAAETLGIPVMVTGDVTGDYQINASDAATVLMHAAAVGGGNDPLLTDTHLTAGDVNEDGAVNASDAAQILMYAAAKGAGGDATFPISGK